MMNLLLMLQEGAAHASESGGEHAEPYRLVTWANQLFGPAALALERAIMPSIYGLFGAHWTPPPPDQAIPDSVVFAVIAFVLCTVGLWAFRGTLSVDRP